MSSMFSSDILSGCRTANPTLGLLLKQTQIYCWCRQETMDRPLKCLNLTSWVLLSGRCGLWRPLTLIYFPNSSNDNCQFWNTKLHKGYKNLFTKRIYEYLEIIFKSTFSLVYVKTVPLKFKRYWAFWQNFFSGITNQADWQVIRQLNYWTVCPVRIRPG